MITQVFHQDHLKVDGLRNQTVKDSSGRCNKQKLTLKGLKLGSLKTETIDIFGPSTFHPTVRSLNLVVRPFTLIHGSSIRTDRLFWTRFDLLNHFSLNF